MNNDRRPVHLFNKSDAEQELAHVEEMVSMLERMDVSDEAGTSSTAVLKSEYWRKRVLAVLARSSKPSEIAERAESLLRRLNAIK